MEELFGGVYAFMATAWGDAGFQAVELDQVHRQSDKEEIEILDALRIGKLMREFDMPISNNWLKEDLTVESCVDYLHRLNEICHRPGEPLPPGAVTLCARRNDALDINNKRMRDVKGTDVLFRGLCGTGYPKWLRPTAIDMTLRVGARVVVLANSHDNGYVNGDMGTLLAANAPKATVFLDKGFEVTLGTFKWTYHTYEAMLGEDGKNCVVPIPVCHFYQTPLAPAYAMTIHKAQGMTLDAANIALGGGNCFSTGQLYTGVSRTRSLRNLSIDRPLREEDCLVDQKVVDFYNRTFPRKTTRTDED